MNIYENISVDRVGTRIQELSQWVTETESEIRCSDKAQGWHDRMQANIRRWQEEIAQLEDWRFVLSHRATDADQRQSARRRLRDRIQQADAAEPPSCERLMGVARAVSAASQAIVCEMIYHLRRNDVEQFLAEPERDPEPAPETVAGPVIQYLSDPVFEWSGRTCIVRRQALVNGSLAILEATLEDVGEGCDVRIAADGTIQVYRIDEDG